MAQNNDDETIYKKIILLLEKQFLNENELLKYIIDVKNIKINDLLDCITTDELITKSYDNNNILKFIIKKYNLNYVDIEEYIIQILKNKEVIIFNCYHELTYEGTNQFDLHNNCNVKCKKCNIKYKCLFCRCVASLTLNMNTHGNFNHSINKTSCINCKRKIIRYICLKCDSAECYCGCLTDYECECID